MYTTCIFCKRPLPSNEVVEEFPVGRRLAFDIDRGLRRAWFKGEDARRVATAIVPLVNREGGTRNTVRRAVDAIESSGHPTRLIADVVNRKHSGLTGRTGYVRAMPKPLRLAVEMSLHEEQERRALEGELWILEQAWREAEEIAAIADKLLLPAHADEFFERHGGKGTADDEESPLRHS